ncbi:MAG TPA: amidophosphoribosyltransferase [Bacillota bacterium]|nr:amidophosphoribosyltransferase [Bacillota bacterium]
MESLDLNNELGLSEDAVRDECGVFGAVLQGPAAESIFMGLVALQHRGQESAGIAAFEGNEIKVIKDMGLATEVFARQPVNPLKGHSAIGHVRYSTTGSSDIMNAQPMTFRYIDGMMALAHNGNITNASQLRRRLGKTGVVFQTTSDSELIGCTIARGYDLGMLGAIRKAMETLDGAYSFIVLQGDTVYAARDPHGFRPLLVGEAADGSGYYVASESCALDVVGAVRIRDVEPGEIIYMTKNGIHSAGKMNGARHSSCIFEYVYLARPDSCIDDIGVAEARFELGRQLARECRGLEADIVVPVPESGIGAAQGFAQESGLPYVMGMIKNRYMGRTFIQPTQNMREMGVRLKLNAVSSLVRGKRVVLVDDSIVRGTTSRKLVDLMKRAGATEVHFVVSSPPVKFGCHYGIDTTGRGELAATVKTTEQIRQMIGAESLHYLSMEGLVLSVERARRSSGSGSRGFCTACFDGKYPTAIDAEENKTVLERFGEPREGSATYRSAGVDIDAGNKSVDLIKPHVNRTKTKGVMGGLGGFGALYDVSSLGMKEPVLVSGTDGVGTKLRIAIGMDKHDTIGIDCVAMCVNDCLVSGAKPIFFLDYIALGKLEPELVASIVKGIADGCDMAGCALVGGETAEMPGFYPYGEYDVAGFAVGAVEKKKMVDGSKIKPGDVVVGLSSNGLHSNGYSLARRVLLADSGLYFHEHFDELGCTLGEELLKPTRIYVKPMLALMEKVEVLGMAHITGGGLVENPIRCLPEGCGMELDLGSWEVPPVFGMIQRLGKVEALEMLRVFNMGLGFLAIVRPEDAQRAVKALTAAGEKAQIVGRITSGRTEVSFKQAPAKKSARAARVKTG